jgi:mercuric ion binding protein
MTCPSCPVTIKAAIKKLQGINKIKASLEEKNVLVDFESQKTNVAKIKEAIESVGYTAIIKECKK